MNIGDRGPAPGEHDGGGIQLHGAGAESDHAVAKRQILGGEAVDVAEELVLGMVLVEDGLFEETGGAGQV